MQHPWDKTFIIHKKESGAIRDVVVINYTFVIKHLSIKAQLVVLFVYRDTLLVLNQVFDFPSTATFIDIQWERLSRDGLDSYNQLFILK